MTKIKIIHWGIKDYSVALLEQRKLREQRTKNEIGDTLIITQHYPIMTIGRSGSSENIIVNKKFLNENGIQVVEVERGGDITYHGPGQLVAYPIFYLSPDVRDVKKFVRAIELVVVETCRYFGANAVTIEKLTGVWISENKNCPKHLEKWSGEKKIASIGLAFKKWTSFHGVALNVNNDLTPFNYINLCGLKGKQATSLEKVLNKKIDFEKVQSIFEEKMSKMWINFNKNSEKYNGN